MLELSGKEFKRVIENVKNCTSKDKIRGCLQGIHLVAKNDKIIFESLNAYFGSKCTIETDTPEEIDITFENKDFKSLYKSDVITMEIENNLVKISDNNNNIVMCKIYEGEFFDSEPIFRKKEKNIKIGLDAGYLQKILKGATKDDIVIFEISEELAPVLIEVKEKYKMDSRDRIKIEKALLPVRINK